MNIIKADLEYIKNNATGNYTCETYNYFLMRLVLLEKYQHICIFRDHYAVVQKMATQNKNTRYWSMECVNLALPGRRALKKWLS